MRVKRENLISALQSAIAIQQDDEAEQGFARNSAYVEGLIQVLKAVREGKQLEIED